MYFSRFMFGGASMLFLSMLLAMQTSCADEKPKVRPEHLIVTCTTTLTVGDPNNGVNEPDAYVCAGTTVTWNANGHTFHVFFKHHQCPFSGNCKNITDQHPTSDKMTKYAKLTVFDYGIVIDDVNFFDPHVVGGGY